MGTYNGYAYSKSTVREHEVFCIQIKVIVRSKLVYKSFICFRSRLTNIYL